MSDRQPTPEEARDMLDRITAHQMRRTAAMLQLGAARTEATISMRHFVRTVQAIQAGEADELQQHPDMLELDVSTASWYPQESA